LQYSKIFQEMHKCW